MRSCLALLIALLGAAPAWGKDYSAERYDVRIRPQADGSILVTEAVTLRFEGGPFTTFYRDIPTRRTDGIEIISASMNDRLLRRGTGTSEVEVDARRSRVRVRWRFAPVSDAAREFALTYVAHGVIERGNDEAELRWRALPSEHRYRMASVNVSLDAGAIEERPIVRSRRTGSPSVSRAGDRWTIRVANVGSNGWIDVAASLPASWILHAPRWQQERERQRAMMPRLAAFAALAAVLGIAGLLLLRAQYPSPPPLDDYLRTEQSPPSGLDPALAGAVFNRGRVTNRHAFAAIVHLAQTGVLTIEATRGAFRSRRFVLRRAGEPAALLVHENALLDVLFEGTTEVDLSKAAGRLTRKGGRFRSAATDALRHSGLLDEHRTAARRRLFFYGLVLTLASAPALAVGMYAGAGPFSLLVFLAIALVAVAVFIVASRLAELSDEGMRQRERWRAYRQHLASQLSASEAGAPRVLDRLPCVIALGLGPRVAAWFRKHGRSADLPPWFGALGADDAAPAFAAFIGASTASSGSGGGAGSAGGGASGAS